MMIEMVCAAWTAVLRNRLSAPDSKDGADRFAERQTDVAVPLQSGRTTYIGGRVSERQSATRSSMTAVPTHMTVSAPPQ